MTDSPLHLDHADAPRIIVLGATGYAGSLVVDALLAQGAPVSYTHLTLPTKA